jgi:hypothetical protein
VEGLIEGRIVHYVLMNGEHRPAIIVKVWDVANMPPENGCSNLQVFMDYGENDGGFEEHPYPLARLKTSVLYDESCVPGTWHWIKRSEKLEKESDWTPIQIRIQSMDLALRCKEHEIDEASLIDLSNRIYEIIKKD